MRALTIAALALAAAAQLFVTPAVADIDPKRVHVVDHRLKTLNGGPALIFRGNTPVNDAGTALNYTTWFDTMATNAKAQIGFQFDSPEKVYIVDICFENAVLDYQYQAEVDFWKDSANDKKGEFVNWILLGSMNYPPDFTAAQQDQMARNSSLWDNDHLPTRVNAIRQMMLQGPPAGYTQLAIFFHCTHGQDRTGEFANAYRLAFHSSIQDNRKLASYTPSQKMIAAAAAPPALKAGGNGHLAVVEQKKSAAVADDLTTMGKIYALGCDEGLRCPMYTFTANAGWYCLWSNAYNGTSYTDCAQAYSCIPLLFCSATNV